MKERKILERKFTFVWDIPLFHVEQPVAGLGWTGSQSFRSHVEQPVAGLVRTYYRDSSLNNFSFFIKKNIDVVFFLY